MEWRSEGTKPNHWKARVCRAAACLGPIAASVAVAGSIEGASAEPVAPLVADEAGLVVQPVAHASPTGEQVIAYLRSSEGSLQIPGLVSRTDGAPFSPFETLSATPSLDSPTIGFGSNGTALLAWPSVTGTEQTVRIQGGPVATASPVGDCSGPVAIAISNSDRTLAGCRTLSNPSHLWSGAVGLGRMPSPISPTETIIPTSEDSRIRPLTAWGADGTGVVAFGYSDGGSPLEQRIEARIFGRNSSFTESEQVDSVIAPETIEPTGAAVLADGTIAITAEADNGAVLFTRPPGPDASFGRTDLTEDTAAMPSTDRFNRLHFLTSVTNPAGETTWWVRILEPDRSLRQAIPVPTEGDEPEPVEGGLIVYSNGAEAIVTKSNKGFFIAFRKPGAGAFSVPRRLASTTNTSYGSAERTSEGDILLAWERLATPGRSQVMVGGWDSGVLPVIEKLTIPWRVRRGARVRYSVVATDSMGISRITWEFPGGRRIDGPSVWVRLRKPGVNRVRVSVYDRSGARSIRIRRVKVVVPGVPRIQGLTGTSGSPRP